MASDLNFYFDPVCPFAWITSKWVRMVALRRDYSVDWRFISLRLINADVDYATHFPADWVKQLRREGVVETSDEGENPRVRLAPGALTH